MSYDGVRPKVNAYVRELFQDPDNFSLLFVKHANIFSILVEEHFTTEITRDDWRLLKECLLRAKRTLRSGDVYHMFGKNQKKKFRQLLWKLYEDLVSGD